MDPASSPTSPLGSPGDRAWLWGVAYRITGIAADADEIVQETWLRALEQPPGDTSRPWRPWLTRVAVNLARDRLRARRRRDYVGPWLPSPVPDEVLTSAEARLGDVETASFALLEALERLTPGQRAVWVLREVAELDVAATAEALAMTPTNVKVTHHRARAALGRPFSPSPPIPRDDAMQLVHQFLWALSTGDLDTLRRVVAPDVRCVSDGGGEYTAAKVPFSGFDRVMAFYVGKARKDGPPDRFALGWYNGAPALLAEHDQVRGKWAPRWVMRLEIGADGLIHRLDSVLTTRKLASVPPLR